MLEHAKYNNQVHGCCNIAVHSWQHVLSCMNMVVVDLSWFTNNVVQVCSFIKLYERSVPTCMNKPVNNTVHAGQLNHVQACQQHCSSWPFQPCSSLSRTLFKLAISTMFKPVKNTIQAGHLNHVQACQEHYSSWPAQPCSSLSTTLFKLTISTMLKPVNSKKHVRFYVCIDKGISLGTKTFVQHRATWVHGFHAYLWQVFIQLGESQCYFSRDICIENQGKYWEHGIYGGISEIKCDKKSEHEKYLGFVWFCKHVFFYRRFS